MLTRLPVSGWGRGLVRVGQLLPFLGGCRQRLEIPVVGSEGTILACRLCIGRPDPSAILPIPDYRTSLVSGTRTIHLLIYEGENIELKNFYSSPTNSSKSINNSCKVLTLSSIFLVQNALSSNSHRRSFSASKI